MKLNAAKRRHIVTVYAAICHMVQQMEEVGRTGRSPTGMGTPLTPLAEGRMEPILTPLREVMARLRHVATELAPTELAAFERPQSVNSSLVWLSNLLERVRIAVDDLHPSRVRKYGPMTHDEEAALAAIHCDLLDQVRASREALMAEET